MSKKMLLFIGLLFSIFSVEVSCMDPDHVGRVVATSTGYAIGTVALVESLHALGLPVAFPTLVVAAECGAHTTLIVALGGDKVVGDCLEKGRCCSRENANYGGMAIAVFAPAAISAFGIIAGLVAMNG